MLTLLTKLIKHKVTWRFLMVLGASLGLTGLTTQLQQLEAITCSVLTCGD